MSAAMEHDVDLEAVIGSARLPGPVMTAAGCGGFGRELARFGDLTALGALVTSPLTAPGADPGPPPRVTETPSGVLHTDAAGTGVTHFVDRDLPWLHAVGARVVAAVAGSSSGQFAEVATHLRSTPDLDAVVAVELDLSRPNRAGAGAPFSDDPTAAVKVIARVREQLPRDLPILVKLGVGAADLIESARACVAGGAAGLVLAGEVPALGPWPATERTGPVHARLSGPAILPVTARVVWQVRAAMAAGRVQPAAIIGAGGVRSAADAMQLIAAGATAVQVGTAVLADPATPWRVTHELAAELRCHGLARLRDAVGAAHTEPVGTAHTEGEP